jgi:hypothetical protein
MTQEKLAMDSSAESIRRIVKKVNANEKILFRTFQLLGGEETDWTTFVDSSKLTKLRDREV